MYPATASAFQLAKLTVVSLCAVGVLACLVAEWADRPPAVVGMVTSAIRTPWPWVLAALAVGLAIAVASAENSGKAIVGAFSRYEGAAPYLAYVVLFGGTVLAFNYRTVHLLIRAVLISGVLVAAYAVLQSVGADPLEFETLGLAGVFSTMGNPNFASSYMGLTVPTALGAALTAKSRTVWWWLGFGALPVLVVGIVGTASTQGPIVALAGAALIGSVAIWESNSRVREAFEPRSVRIAAAAVAFFVVVLGSWLMVQVVNRGLGSRTFIYEVGLQLMGEAPLTGIGFGSFLEHFMLLRSAEHARLYGGLSTNTAHSVPLNMFVSGGLLLGLAYMAFVVLTGWLLIVGVRRGAGYERLAIATLGGAWLGYQVQSLISIDVPPLAAIHWIMAGGIVALSWPLRRQSDGDSPTGNSHPRGRRGPIPTWARAAAVLLVLASLPLVTRPLRADLAAADGVRVLSAGQTGPGLESLRSAQRLAPWESTYVYLEATSLERLGDTEAAYAAMQRAASLEPGSSQYAVFAAQFADALDRPDEAAHWFAQATSRDPVNIAVLLESADFFRNRGEHSRARSLYSRVLELDPGNPTAAERLAALDS